MRICAPDPNAAVRVASVPVLAPEVSSRYSAVAVTRTRTEARLFDAPAWSQMVMKNPPAALSVAMSLYSANTISPSAPVPDGVAVRLHVAESPMPPW